MNHEKKFPNRVRYEYIEDKDAKLNTAHGVWGGINPQGEIELNFYTESDKIPAFAESVVSSDGTLGPELSPVEEDLRIIKRYIHTRLLLNYRTAFAIREWLDDKIDLLEIDETSIILNDDTGIEQ